MTSPTSLNYTAYTDLSASIPEWWADGVEMDADSQEFWSKFEGAESENSNMPILRRDGRLSTAGSKEYFTTMAEFYGSGVTGETELRGQEEKYDLDDYYLEVEWLRHAISFTKKAQKRSIADLAKLAAPALARWLARRKDHDMDYRLITTESPTTLYAGEATSAETIDTSNKFSWYSLQKGYNELEAIGAEPYEMTTERGERFPVYGVCITEKDAHWLRNDAMWIKSQAEANVRDAKNPLFTNAIGMTAGMIVYVRRGIRGKPISYLRPEAKLYTAHDATSSTDNDLDSGNARIVVGPNNGRNWTKMFPSSGTISITGATGVTEFVSYSAKGDYYFTITSRGATYGTIASTVAEYDAGCLVTLGAHESRQIFFGSRIAYRCFASPFVPIGQKDDFDFIQGIGIAGEFGQCSIKNSDDTNKNYVIMKSNSIPSTAADYAA